MTVLYEMNNSAIEWFQLVEPKIFVDKWMILRDEDHTHHLTPQDHYNYKSKWWLRSNKIRSDTMPIRCRSDFKTSIVNFAAIERKRRRRSSTKPTMGTKFFFFMVELARFLVDSLFLWKSPWRWTKYWLNRATCYTSNWNNSSRHDFLL